MDDLIIEIISRVSVKDLMRFTCVSKSWCSLIYTDPSFHRLHFQRAASLHRPFVFIVKRNVSETEDSFYHWLNNYSIDPESIDDQNINPIEISDPFNEADARIIGSCHGMLVLRHNPSLRMAVSNPTTKKHHLVPPNPAGDDNVDFLGFGYDHVHDRYKLVTRTKPAPSGDHINTLMIYDVKDGAWRKCLFDDLGLSDYFSCLHYWPAQYVDGFMYYYVDLRTRSVEVMKIIRLDLAKEEFHVLESPKFGEVVYNPTMTVFDGRLCLHFEAGSFCLLCQGLIEGHEYDYECACRSEPYYRRIEFWTMEGSSYCSRWTKFLSIPHPDFYALIGEPSAVLSPLCFAACGNRVLIGLDWRLFWYDLEKDEFVELHRLTNRLGLYSVEDIGCYVPSLILG